MALLNIYHSFSGLYSLHLLVQNLPHWCYFLSFDSCEQFFFITQCQLFNRNKIFCEVYIMEVRRLNVSKWCNITFQFNQFEYTVDLSPKYYAIFFCHIHYIILADFNYLFWVESSSVFWKKWNFINAKYVCVFVCVCVLHVCMFLFICVYMFMCVRFYVNVCVFPC